MKEQDVEKLFKDIAAAETWDKYNPNAEEIKRLNSEYNLTMADYEKALDTNDSAANVILQKANQILAKINELDPKLKKISERLASPTMEELDEEANELTKRHNHPKEKIH